MDRRQISLTVVGITIIFLAAAVTANSLASSTPLYTLRMEQASNRMNFLPTAVNEFTYSAENGYTVDYTVNGCCVQPLKPPTEFVTCPATCDEETCWSTCPETCWSTCPLTCDDPTCPATCAITCSTCTQPTCETCETCYTCPTQTSTCNTCKGQETCWDTCEIDCL
jgi:hypothetical protein